MPLPSQLPPGSARSQPSAAGIESAEYHSVRTESFAVSTDAAGDLWIDLGSTLGHPCRLQISGWSNGVHFTSHLSDESVLLDPFDEVGFTLSMLRRQDGAQQWVDALSPQVAVDLVWLERLYYGSQFAALWLMSRSTAAVELFLSAPTLFYVLLENGRSGRMSAEKLLTLMDEKRTFLLGLCGLPDSRACLRLLQTLPANQLYPDDTAVIRRFLTVPGWEQVNHQHYIDIPLLRWFSDRPALLGSRLLRSYDPSWSWREFITLCDDILLISRQLERDDGYRRVLRCRNMRELNGLHDRLVVELNKLTFAEEDNEVFGAPPLPGSRFIQPIRDTRALHEEGTGQRHCIASYQYEILAGRYYAYRILAPERATLGIAIDRLGTPSIAQLKLKFNGTPSDDTQSAVQAWFSSAMLIKSRAERLK